MIEQHANCPLCGSIRSTTLSTAGLLLRVEPDRILRCAECGMVYRNPPLTVDRATEIYNNEYYQQYEQSTGMAGDLNGVARVHLKRRLIDVETRTGVGQMLEIGCGKGALLEFARSRGWTTQGVEVSENAGHIARDKGLNVHIGPVETMPRLAAPVDFIHLNHVLEHLTDPVGVLRQIKTMLASSGIIVLEVPNEFDNLFYRIGRLALPTSSMLSPIPSTHQCFFTPSTLRRAVELAGLTMQRLRTVRWTIGDRSGWLGKAIRRAVYLIERPLERAGNIEVVAVG